MRIGMVATRLGDVDGVSFEALKWRTVLSEMGHEVRLCAGSLGPFRAAGDVEIAELHFAHPPAAAVTSAAFSATGDPVAVRTEIDRQAADLRARLAAWLDAVRPDVLIVQNAWAIPMHVPLGVALAGLVADTGVAAIGHHHDYWWERERFAGCVVPEVLDMAFPPDLPTIAHVSINQPAVLELRRRRGLASTVIPNVFDFDQPLSADAASEAERLRAELGLGAGDLLFVQPTRVVPRKGIELAIELVARLGYARSVFLITSPAGDEGPGYLAEVHNLADRLGVDLRHEPHRFRPTGAPDPDGVGHALADAYVAADVITYASLYEGFGNALVEAMFFRKLTVVNRYAVYDSDIRPHGFRFIELDGSVTEQAVEELRAALADPALRAADAEHNFRLGREHFGYDRLRRQLTALLEEGAATRSG